MNHCRVQLLARLDFLTLDYQFIEVAYSVGGNVNRAGVSVELKRVRAFRIPQGIARAGILPRHAPIHRNSLFPRVIPVVHLYRMDTIFHLERPDLVSHIIPTCQSTC